MLKAAELQAELAKRGLSTDGQKAQLRTRPTAAVGEEARQAAARGEVELQEERGRGFHTSANGRNTKRARGATCKKIKDCKKYL